MQPGGIVVMYHYVRPDRAVIPGGIRPLLVSEFEMQLDWLAERYDVLPAEAFLSRVAAGQFAPKPPCLLTFDDGTRDHAEVATPILARRGLSGVFFALTWPAELGRMPLTHALHWLLGQSDETVWQLFESFALAELGGVAALGDEADARRIYHYESPLRARIKYAANMALPAEAAERIVSAAMQRAGINEADLAREWFASADQLRAMDRAGMTIALHGVSHRSLQTIGPPGIRDELHHASDYFTQLLGKRPQWWACPFGGSGASVEATAAMRDAMKAVGIRASVSTVKAMVAPGSDLLALPRFDAIDLPPKKEFSPPMGHR